MMVYIFLYCSRQFSSCPKLVLPTQLLQARLQHYVNCELSDVPAGFRKGRGIRDQTANIHRITEKAREFQKNIYFCFIDYAKAFDCVDHNTVENSYRDRNIRPPYLPPEKSVCRLRNTVRTRQGITIWFQIGKGVCQIGKGEYVTLLI